MTGETQPTPGQVIGEDDVAKLRAGDVLRKGTRIVRVTGAEDDCIGYVFTNEGHDNFTAASVSDGAPFTFIGRPGPDGFIPWTGGENPFGEDSEVLVECKFGDGSQDVNEACIWDWVSKHSPIIAFRLSPPAGSPPSSKTEHVAGDAVSGAVERQGEVPFYAVKHAISVAMQDAKNGHPCGCIVEAGCEARGYVDPEYAAAQFIWEAAEKAVLAMLGHPRQEQPASAETADAAQAAENADLKARNKALEEGLEPGDRYPFVFRDRSTWGKVGVSFSQGTDYIRFSMLRENKPGGAWGIVDMTPDEAEQFALRTLERARTARTLTEADHGR